MAIRVSSPAFVGREPELDRVSAALDEARGGVPAVFLVAGEAGVGKTRFVQEVATRARRSGLRVLAGGCFQLGGDGLPFGPIVEALRGLTDELPPAEVDRLVGSGRSELNRLMPGLHRTGPGGPAMESDASGQGRLFEHLLLFFNRLAGLAPLLLVIEDIHWADRSSLELLGFLVHNLRTSPIVVIATYRSDELHRSHPLLPFLAGLERGGRTARLELSRFNRRELAHQVEGIVGRQSDPDLLEEIYARSEGNAFFAEELLANGTSRGRLPATLREVLVERLATLGEPAQELARLASAAGARINVRLLSAVSGTPEAGLSPALREAVARQILVPADGAHDDGYAFRHALVREAIYEDLLPDERTRLHAAFAQAIADEGHSDADASTAAELAYHWQAAHELPRALGAWIRAGLAAEAIYAPAEAQTHFERALGLWDHVPDAAAYAPLDRVQVLIHAAAAAEGRAGARAVAHIRSALAFVNEKIDPARAGLLHERLGEYTLNLPNTDNGLAEYRDAVRLVPSEPPSAARALTLAGLGRALYHTWQYAESVAACENAIEVARTVGAREVESKALVFLGSALRKMGDVDKGMAALHRALEVARESASAFAAAHAMTWLAMGFVANAQWEDAVALGLKADAHAVQHGLAARFGGADLMHAAVGLIALGRWDEAAAVLERAAQYSPSIHDSDIEECATWLEALRGQFPSATRRAARFVPINESPGSYKTRALTELALWQGDPLAARQTTAEILAWLDGRNAPLVTEDAGGPIARSIRAEADLAALARAKGSDREVQLARRNGTSLLARFRSLVEEEAARRPFYKLQADGWLLTCEAEWSRLEGASDPDLWAGSAAAWNVLEMPYERAYALMREAQAVLAARGDRYRAAAAAREAYAIADRLGAKPLKSKVEELAFRAGVRLGPEGIDADGAGDRAAPVKAGGTGSASRGDHPRDSPRLRYELTRRELEVLDLVAAGRSDGEIAAELFISKKTVSVHVANIKGKLGAESRREIVTGAIRLGLIKGLSADVT